jgi:steroid 5-alpha reductase family enzyme
MLKTIILLITTLLVIPVVAFYFDEPLTTLQKDSLTFATMLMLGVAAYCFVVGELTHNNSQVDKLWSIVPIAYASYFAYASDWQPRVTLMALLVAVWGIRLTYNFSRRGAYTWKFWSGEEDYRWQVLRNDPMFNGKWKWMAFNLFFICLYQNGLILLFTLPAVKAMDSELPLTLWDYALAVLILLAIAIEYIADQQQYDYQSEKYRRINSGEPLEGAYADGFVSSGLWKHSRHPNYAAEQSIWVLFYFFSVIATGQFLNWSAAGCLLLILLFQGSADFSEKISAGKYKNYTTYLNKTGRFFPKLF